MVRGIFKTIKEKLRSMQASEENSPLSMTEGEIRRQLFLWGAFSLIGLLVVQKGMQGNLKLSIVGLMLFFIAALQFQYYTVVQLIKEVDKPR